MTNFDLSLSKILSRENMSFQEANAAMLEIMEGKVSPVKLAGWLAALRMKGETAAELAGLASAMREKALSVRADISRAADIVGTGGDGARTINVSTAAAFVAAGAGAVIAKHGNRAVSSSSGSADVSGGAGGEHKAQP